MVPLLLLPPPAERICENGAAPASSAFGSGGEDAVCGGADLEGGGRVAVAAEREEEVGRVEAVLGMGSPGSES